MLTQANSFSWMIHSNDAANASGFPGGSVHNPPDRTFSARRRFLSALGRLPGSGRGGVVVTGSVVTAADAREATGHQDFGTIPSIATVGLEDPDDADESEGQQLLEEPEEDL